MSDSVQAGDRRNTNSSNSKLGLKPSTQLLLIVQSLPISPLVGEKHTNILKKNSLGIFLCPCHCFFYKTGLVTMARSPDSEIWKQWKLRKSCWSWQIRWRRGGVFPESNSLFRKCDSFDNLLLLLRRALRYRSTTCGVFEPYSSLLEVPWFFFSEVLRA